MTTTNQRSLTSLGKVDDPVIRAELQNFKAPNYRQKKAMRRVAQIENWLLRSEQWKYSDEVKEYAMRQFHITPGQADRLVKIVVKDLDRIGKVRR